MDNRKYRILRSVHEACPSAPVKRTDYYKNTRTILRNKLLLDELVRFGYLSENRGTHALTITDKGIEVLELECEKRRSFIRESVRYWITTGIALLALLISIIALLSELGILQLQ